MALFKAELAASAANRSGWPAGIEPEVLLCGRSNTGKSSLINALCAQRGLAYVGKAPGKTRLLNFYRTSEGFSLVDAPGYGYARHDRKRNDEFSALMEEYLTSRSNCRGMVLLVDCRRDTGEDERQILELAEQTGRRCLVALTKTDKLADEEKKRRPESLAAQLGISAGRISLTSAYDARGIEQLCQKIRKLALGR